MCGFVGGIDLVEGRFDDFLHRVGDVEVSPSGECFFPGDEYYQPNAPKKKKGGKATVTTAVPMDQGESLMELEDEADAEYLVPTSPQGSSSQGVFSSRIDEATM